MSTIALMLIDLKSPNKCFYNQISGQFFYEIPQYPFYDSNAGMAFGVLVKYYNNHQCFGYYDQGGKGKYENKQNSLKGYITLRKF